MPWVENPAGSGLTEYVDEGAVSDVCPSGWRLSNNRVDIITQVELGRETDEVPTVWDDATGQALYGVEPWSATDLVCSSLTDMTRIKTRLFETRGYTVGMRVESVHFDASTTDAALDLIAKANVFGPSRYRCRLELPRGEIFDREMFVTGVRHTLRPSEWTTEMYLDNAAPWLGTGARWDVHEWDGATSTWN